MCPATARRMLSISPSVTLLIADTTTTSLPPPRPASTTMSATRRISTGPATEVPPNLSTRIGALTGIVLEAIWHCSRSGGSKRLQRWARHTVLSPPGVHMALFSRSVSWRDRDTTRRVELDGTAALGQPNRRRPLDEREPRHGDLASGVDPGTRK